MTKTEDLANLGGGFIQSGAGAQQRRVESKLQDIVNVLDFGADPTGTDDSTSNIQAAIDASGGSTVYFPAGTFKISSDGITLTSDATLVGAGLNTVLQSTPIVNELVGTNRKVGNGNILNATGKANINIKNLSLAGIYQSSWGAQDPYTFTLTASEGKKLLYFHDCSDITLEDVNLLNTFASFIGSTNDTLSGYAPVGISNSNRVRLFNCRWKDSTGEAWLIYRCFDVLVHGCSFVNDRYVSALDLAFCDRVAVTNNIFNRLLESDSGELLNLAARNASITANTFYNGNLDIGNEYLGADPTYGVYNIVASSNTITNGFIHFALPNKPFTGSYIIENAQVIGNTITIDLDTRPAANGSTFLNYAAVTLPAYYASRNISVESNVIRFTGALQSGSALFNNYLPINCVHANTLASIENLSIKNNQILCNLSEFNLDLINTAGAGGIYLANGVFTDTVISGNLIKNGLGIRLSDASFTNTRIENNNISALSFLSSPFKNSSYTWSNMVVRGNEFNFVQDVSYTYTINDFENFGTGAFMALFPTESFVFNSLVVADNTVSSPIFIFNSNFNTMISCFVDLLCTGNSVTFIDYTLGSITSTYAPVRIGRVNPGEINSAAVFNDNRFLNSSSSSVKFHCEPIKYFELRNNSFRGNYSFTLIASSTVLSEDYNGLVVTDNVSVGGAITTVFAGLSATTDILIKGNSDNFDDFCSFASTISGAC